MRTSILKILEKIEQDYDVKVLLAVESGSRSWGFQSLDSDYDVRFIYIHKQEWYLSIDTKCDVIEIPINKMLDINGWDIRKALKLLRKSNPSLLEWISSPIVYSEDVLFIEQLRTVKECSFQSETCLYHYYKMAKTNYSHSMKQNTVRIKKYFNVLRPLLACMWIEQNNSAPPVEFEKLVQHIIKDESLLEAIWQLLKQKRDNNQSEIKPKITVLNTFIESELERLIPVLKQQKQSHIVSSEVFDVLFRQTLQHVWKK